MASFMPRNDFNHPAGASLATGGGQSTNVYAGGVYDLADGEALFIDAEVFEPPAYMGFHLSNVWGESHDFANHVSSLNGTQAQRDDDGHYRYVVAHRDPGVPNWLDTTGLPRDSWPCAGPTLGQRTGCPVWRCARSVQRSR